MHHFDFAKVVHGKTKKRCEMSLGDRLKIVRGNESQKDFGSKYGVNANTIFRYENDQNPPNAEFISAVCSDYRVNANWLLFGEGEKNREGVVVEPQASEGPEPQESNTIYIDEHGLVEIPSLKNPNIEDFYFLPMVETRLSAGAGSFVISEAVETYYAFRKSFINRIATSHKNLVLACATGNSMEKTIYDGDTVMIDVGRRNIEDGKIFAVRFGETITIKRLSLLPNNKVMVISDNKEEYEPYEAQAKDIHVIGKLLISSHLHA